jgi:hypothetical protein
MFEIVKIDEEKKEITFKYGEFKDGRKYLDAIFHRIKGKYGESDAVEAIYLTEESADNKPNLMCDSYLEEDVVEI